MEKLQRDLERKRKLMEAQVAALQAEFTAKEEEVKQLINQEKRHEKAVDENQERNGSHAKRRQRIIRLRNKGWRVTMSKKVTTQRSN